MVFKSLDILQKAFRLKDHISHFINSNVICIYLYNTSNDVYIGETKNHLLAPYYDHMGKSILTDKLPKYNGRNAASIKKHFYHKNQAADMCNPNIIGNVTNSYHLKSKECLKIMKLRQSLNIGKASTPLYLSQTDS